MLGEFALRDGAYHASNVFSAMVYEGSLDWLDDYMGTSCTRSCKFPCNSRTCRNLHFDHDQSEEGFYRVGANLHASADLFAGETLQEELHGFAFSPSQTKLGRDFRK